MQRTENWTRAWRLPYERLDLFPGGELRARAAMPAGVRLLFGVNATGPGTLAGRIVPEQVQPAQPPRLDVVFLEHIPAAGSETQGTPNDARAATPQDDPATGTAGGTESTGDQPPVENQPLGVEIGPDGGFEFDVPAGDSVLEIWLPQSTDFRLRDLTLPDGARLLPYRPPQRPRWLAYGSSITQCASAPTPTRTWPALVARSLGWDLTCLGFAGECHLDPMIARTIADRPADLVTACLGINVYGQGSFNARSYLPAVLGFISAIRDGHPDIPIVLISPICSPEREETSGAAGMTLRGMREQLAEAHRLLHGHGDSNLHLVNGPDLLGEAQSDLLGDGLHPTGEGYAAIAKAIAPTLDPLLSR